MNPSGRFGLQRGDKLANGVGVVILAISSQGVALEKGDGNQNRSWWLHLLSWAQRTWRSSCNLVPRIYYIIEQFSNISAMVARCVGRRRRWFFRVYD